MNRRAFLKSLAVAGLTAWMRLAPDLAGSVFEHEYRLDMSDITFRTMEVDGNHMMMHGEALVSWLTAE